jgi:hypothetical protein
MDCSRDRCILIPVLTAAVGQPPFSVSAPDITHNTTSASGTAGTSTVIAEGGATPITYSIVRIGGSTNIFNTTDGSGGSTTINFSFPGPGSYNTTFRWTATDDNGIIVTTDFTVTVNSFGLS